MNDWERERRDRALLLTRPRVFRDRTNPIDMLPDEEFRRRFRLTRRAFFHVVDMMTPDFDNNSQRGLPLSCADALSITLATFSNNNFQLRTADEIAVSQSTVSRAISSVTDWFSTNSNMFVRWHTANEARAMQQRIFSSRGLPGIVGLVDGTQIRIQSPVVGEHLYVNR